MPGLTEMYRDRHVLIFEIVISTLKIKAEKILTGMGTVGLIGRFWYVTAETPLPSKRLVIRSRKVLVGNDGDLFFRVRVPRSCLMVARPGTFGQHSDRGHADIAPGIEPQNLTPKFR
ncbi:hypothetical protein NVSP9465_03335 [Novosphingobium sp. CECT 9465]|nr:hypothetical protein NVSP9465_03335 [Novosphingobium sp. CECT 9465]